MPTAQDYYSDMTINALALKQHDVTFDRIKWGLGMWAPHWGPTLLAASNCNSPPIKGQCTNDRTIWYL